MEIKIDKIILTREVRKQQNLPVKEDNTDVIIKMDNGDVYLACFFSYEDIEQLRKKHLKNRQFLNGSYFWVKGMILIQDYERKTIQRVIKNIQAEGNFKDVFMKI